MLLQCIGIAGGMADDILKRAVHANDPEFGRSLTPAFLVCEFLDCRSSLTQLTLQTSYFMTILITLLVQSWYTFRASVLFNKALWVYLLCIPALLATLGAYISMIGRAITP